MKACYKCNEPKDLEQFYRNKSKIDGRHSECIECSKKWGTVYYKDYYNQNREKKNKQNKIYYHKNRKRILEKERLKVKDKAKLKEIQLLCKYNLSLEDYNAILEIQNNRCAICQNSFSNENMPYVDHDHQTNVNRGLLCHGCNSGLGFFKDNPHALRVAADYIEIHKNLLTTAPTPDTVVI